VDDELNDPDFLRDLAEALKGRMHAAGLPLSYAEDIERLIEIADGLDAAGIDEIRAD
jgi:hypothetical protein